MSPLRRIFGYFFARRWMAVGTLSAHVVQILLSLGLPLLLKSAIDNGLASNDYRLVVFAAAATMGLTIVRAVVWYFVSYNYARLSTAVSYTMRDQLYEKIQRNNLAFQLKSHSGDLFSLSSSDVQAVEEFLGNGINQAVNITGLGLALFIILMRLDA